MSLIGVTHKGIEIAAWVVKGDPSVFPIDEVIESGETIESWSVHQSYRTELMEAGQKCLLWMSGASGAFVAEGLLTGEVELHEADVDEWLDKEKARNSHLYAMLELRVLEEPIEREFLRQHPLLSQIELMRMPQGSNPSILSPPELTAIEQVLGREVGDKN
jgi:hypothetical protein